MRAAVHLPAARRAGTALAMLMLGLPALAGCGSGGPAYSSPAAGIAATVDMTPGFGFSPADLTVEIGDTVEWRNRTLFTHTVTADPARNAGAHLPADAEPFHSGDIPPGGIFRYSFAAPGLYRYVCLPHDGFGMTGTVTVRP